MIKNALLSVSDKTGIVDFAKGLVELGVTIYSTGGTLKTITDAGIAAKAVESLTGFPEMMDGRVKTLHPKVHGGILAIRDNTEHQKAMADHGIEPIDLVVVNLYPFRETIAKPNVSLGGSHRKYRYWWSYHGAFCGEEPCVCRHCSKSKSLR